MQQINWFERKFDFDFQQNIFPAIIERLEGTPIRLKYKIKSIPESIQAISHEETWSIKENIGHLTDLEDLWQGRLEDILSKQKYLRAWDLENKKTKTADHNNVDIIKLVDDFKKVRGETVSMLRKVDDLQIYQSALHPRLEKPMRLMDLFLFVAEHDDHHLARITELCEILK